MEAKSIEPLQTENSSDSSLQNILKSLNNGELEVEYSIKSSDTIFTPAVKFEYRLQRYSQVHLNYLG